MNNLGINFGYILVQLVNFSLLIGAPLFTLIVVLSLRKRNLGQTAKAVWVLISFIPILGPIAFWVINPQETTID